MSSLKFFIFFTLAFLIVPGSWAQGSKDYQASLREKAPIKVAILPVAIHSPENVAYMREGLWDMLSSRVELQGRVTVLEKGQVKKALSEVSGEIDAESARKVGQLVGADFVVFGSLTKLGDSASLDLKVLEVTGEKPSSSVFIQARKMEEIVVRVDDLARKVDEKILGYPVSPPVERPAVAERPAEAPRGTAGIPAPPMGFQAEPPRGTAGAPASPPGFQPVAPPRAVATSGFWQSTSFPFKIKGVAMGDLEGDGKDEIVLIDERNVYIYRYDNGFNLLKKLAGGRLDHYLAVDVADIKKEGKSRIFVTNLPGDETEQNRRRLGSFVVAYQGGDYRVVASNLEWFLSVVNWPGKGPLLLGQKRGLNTSFEAAIYEMGWDGKGYKESRKIDGLKIFSLYGFTPFVSEGKTFFAFIDSDFRLKVLDQKGKVIWRSVEYYGSNNVFRVKPMPSGTYYEGNDLASVNVRLVSRGDEIFILRNISATGQFFKREKYFTGGEVQNLAWNGSMFMERWRSQEIPGYLVDFQAQNILGAAGNELIVAVNLPKESILSGSTDSALMVSRVQ
jgi:hypothetical protein